MYTVFGRSEESVSTDIIDLQIPTFMHHGQYKDALCLDLIDDSVGVEGQFSHLIIVEFRNLFSALGQLLQIIGFLADILDDLLGIVSGVVSDKIMDGTQIGLGRLRPDHHESISRFNSSLVTV